MLKEYIKNNKFYLLFLVIVVVICNIKLPYYVSAPGGTIDIKDRIVYDKAVDYDGSLNMLYVRQYVANIPVYLMSYVFPDWDLEDISSNQISSDESASEIDLRNKIMLDNSINNAIYVAYKEAGKEVLVEEMEFMVVGTTISNGLEIGDELLKINGEDIKDFNMIKDMINNHNIGDKLKFKIERNDKKKEVLVEIKEMDGVKGIGVVIVTDYDLEIEPEIELEFKKSESGPSGGLMMALSIYSAISGEDILKGRDIAGTGTINMNGEVGEIDGIKYKIIGAVKDKMDVVLVPSGNYEEALKVVKDKNYDIELVKIDTFGDAIEYLSK